MRTNIRFVTTVLSSCAVGFFAVGTLTISHPVWLESTLGLYSNSALARNELYAMYGGSQLGLAVFFAIACVQTTWRMPALCLAALVLGSMAASRIIDMLFVSVPGSPAMLFLCLEILATVGIVVCLLSIRTVHQKLGAN